MNLVEVEIRGHTLFCKNERGVHYDFFIPREDYRIPVKVAKEFIPEMHKFIDSKRTYKSVKVRYEDLLDIAQ